MPQHPISRLRPLLLPILLLTAAFAVKWWYRTASMEDLAFMLRPVAAMVSMITGEVYSVVDGSGYYFPDLHVLIDRSCSGVNFMIITAATFSFLLVRRPRAGCISPLLAIVATFGSYGLTLFVNSSRIITMVHFQRLGIQMGPTVHEALGVFFFLVALLSASLLLDRTLTRTHHAQLT